MNNAVANISALEMCDFLVDQKFRCPLVFADPPDNLGLEYGEYMDKLSKEAYYSMLYCTLVGALQIGATFWLSYYWEHDLEIKAMVRNYLKFQRPTLKAKTFIWRYTFGQHNKHDFGSGYRYLLRITSPLSVMNPQDVRVESERQRMGDSRANPDGRVPDDVWDFSRVVGNATERRPWHPTQHPEALICRIIRMHSNEGDTVVDLFGGTGTMIRAAKQSNRRAIVSEIDSGYAKKIADETGADLWNQDGLHGLSLS